MKVDSQCWHCKHLLRPVQRGWPCVVFPRRVPEEIFSNKHDHRQPYPGDGGIGWEPATPEEASWWDDLERDMAELMALQGRGRDGTEASSSPSTPGEDGVG